MIVVDDPLENVCRLTFEGPFNAILEEDDDNLEEEEERVGYLISFQVVLISGELSQSKYSRLS